jgi:threonine/homoserine/homoserine lactone efflux protein
MIEISRLIVAWMVGFISGLLVSIPVGPVNITILNEGTQRGFRWALLIGVGATTMEVTYCLIGFAGFSGLFGSTVMKATMELVSFMLMFVLGVRYLFLTSLPATTKTVEKMEHRLHPHTGFMIGYLRVMANPGVLLGWITLSATFIAHEWVEPVWPSKLICISGVGIGALVWFIFFSFIASRGKGRLSYQTLVRMSRVSGATLLIMAAVIGVRIIRLLAVPHR